MAGVCVTLGEPADGDAVDAVAAECAAQLDRYEHERLYATGGLTVHAIRYPDYPIRVVEREGFTAIVEGHIYDVDDEAAAAEFLHSRLASGDTDAITDWLCERDGEFLVYHVDEPSGDLTVLSDVLGRIPFFFASPDDATTVAGRSIHFIKRVLEESGFELSMDRAATAQMLLLGYAFERRTPYEQISKSGPAACVELTAGGVGYEKLHEYRFDRDRHADRSVAENADRVVDRLVAACRRRARLDGDHVVALSGGMDSRLVAAALDRVDCEFSAASYYTGRSRATRDTTVAMQVVRELGIDWQLLHATNTAGDMEELLYRKGGLNSLAMGFLVDFFGKLIDSKPGPVHQYTGDFGALIDSGWSVYRDFDSVEVAAEWIAEEHGNIPVADVAAFTGFTPREVVGFVADRLRSFPETEWRASVEHFLTRERGFNRNFNGEDRNRTFCWTHAPLNARPVVSYLIDTPRDQKTDRRLFTALFERLDEALLEIDYAPFGAPMGSREQLLKAKANDLISQSWLQDVAFSILFDESGPPQGVADHVDRQTADGRAGGGPPDDGPLRREQLREFVEHTDEYSTIGAYDLLTLTTVSEYASNGTTSLAEDRERTFSFA